MAYYQYNNYYSDADHHHYYYNHYQYQNQNYHNQYYQPPPPPEPYYYYSDGVNCYQVSDGYCYGSFPVAYYSVAAGRSEMERVELDGGGLSTELVLDGEEEDEEDGYDDFDDYDPTPYGGGYDIEQAYGKPLTASDLICYPRNGGGLEERAVASVPVAVAVDDFECDDDDDESVIESCCDEEASDHGNGLHDEVDGGGGDREYEGEFEKVLVTASDDDARIEYESSSDAPGFCDGVYGYLPCLNKKKNRNVVYDDARNEHESSSGAPGFCDGLYGYLACLNTKKNITAVSGDGWEEKPVEDPWKATADFIFGTVNPYAN